MQEPIITEQGDLRDQIYLLIQEQERTIGWIAQRADVSRSHLTRILKKKERPLTNDILEKLNCVLNTDFKSS